MVPRSFRSLSTELKTVLTNQPNYAAIRQSKGSSLFSVAGGL